MTNEELFEKLCNTQFELLDIYDKHREELAAIGAPEYMVALFDEEQEQVMAELSKRINEVSTTLYG